MITMAIMVLLIIMPKPFMGPVMHHRSHGNASPYPQQSGQCLETWWTSYSRLTPLAKQWEKYQSQSNNHCCFQAQPYWHSPGHWYKRLSRQTIYVFSMNIIFYAWYHNGCSASHGKILRCLMLNSLRKYCVGCSNAITFSTILIIWNGNNFSN